MKKIEQETSNNTRKVRVKHHVVLGAELGLRQALKNVLQLCDTLLHKLPSLFQVNSLPLAHCHVVTNLLIQET